MTCLQLVSLQNFVRFFLIWHVRKWIDCYLWSKQRRKSIIIACTVRIVAIQMTVQSSTSFVYHELANLVSRFAMKWCACFRTSILGASLFQSNSQKNNMVRGLAEGKFRRWSHHFHSINRCFHNIVIFLLQSAQKWSSFDGKEKSRNRSGNKTNKVITVFPVKINAARKEKKETLTSSGIQKHSCRPSS